MSAPYDIRVSERARAMRISVFPDGAVRVTVPRRASRAAIDRFIARYAEWIEKHVRQASLRTVIPARKARIANYKQEAQGLAEARCTHFAERYGIQYRTIAIRAQKSRWGSCSRAGDLSFNYKIVLLPPALADYIIVHELCHLISFDHSRAFWAAVEREIPEHRALRKALRSLIFRFE